MMSERSKVKERIITKQSFFIKKTLSNVTQNHKNLHGLILRFIISPVIRISTRLVALGYTKPNINGSFKYRKLNIGGLEHKSR